MWATEISDVLFLWLCFQYSKVFKEKYHQSNICYLRTTWKGRKHEIFPKDAHDVW